MLPRVEAFARSSAGGGLNALRDVDACAQYLRSQYRQYARKPVNPFRKAVERAMAEARARGRCDDGNGDDGNGDDEKFSRMDGEGSSDHEDSDDSETSTSEATSCDGTGDENGAIERDENGMDGGDESATTAAFAAPEVVAAAVGPTGMVDGWSSVRHDSGWSATFQVARPPSRPVTGEFLQHLLLGVPARRRMSLLYVPTPAATAERRAQTQQVSTESEQTLRARWGFGTSARQRRAWQDAAQREEDLVEGRAVYRIVWLITVTAPTADGLEAAAGQVEAAARRCSLELRRLAGTQRQAFAFTLPLCRGAR